VAESRKTVTIVFADVTGSTALGERTDPEVMRRIMERYFEEMRSVLGKQGEVLRLAGRAEESRGAFQSALAILEAKGWELSADAARAKLAELQSSGSPSQ
jgi:class 3 adenylate cyclase